MSKETTVQIFGQTYTINAALEPGYIQKLAAHVNEKLTRVCRDNPRLDRSKAAVLAALAIADELYSLREEKEVGEEVMKAQVERCLRAVEQALGPEEDETSESRNVEGPRN
jgi:cell division protein ZapA